MPGPNLASDCMVSNEKLLLLKGFGTPKPCNNQWKSMRVGARDGMVYRTAVSDQDVWGRNISDGTIGGGSKNRRALPGGYRGGGGDNKKPQKRKSDLPEGDVK